MRVLKFGGSSVANSACFWRVANILENNTQYGQTASVLSAPENVTNYLTIMVEETITGKNVMSHVRETEYIFIELLQGLADRQPGFDYQKQKTLVEHQFYQLKQELHGIKLLGQCSDLVNATIISRGEKLSIAIMAYLLKVRGNKVTIIDPSKTLLAIGHYLESTVDIAESRRRISANQIPSDHIILMAGFIACNEKGELIVLGRHGSDYSATVLAACLQADYCEIWTNIDGIYTSDPRQVPDAQLLKSISYQEIMELSYFGANILHPRTIAPIAQFKIPCFIKNTTHPYTVGTLISSKSEYNLNPVKAITNLNNMVMFNISAPGMKDMVVLTSRLFAALSFNGISVVLINQSISENSISFCVSQKKQVLAHNVLEEEFYSELKTGLLNPFDKIEQLAIISLIGDGIRASCDISAKLFLALARANINIGSIVQGSCERSISVVVKNYDIINNMQVLHKMLFTINQIVEVFVIGVGGVGSALLNQLNRQQVCLKQKHIDLRVCGIANSRILLTNINGIELSNWQDKLSICKKLFNINNLIYLLKKYQLINPIIIDCTSSQEVADRYSDFLENGFHVITSNKKANTSSWMCYQKIRISAAKSRRKFLYDTNVGAGLPVIENLQNLLNAGDKLIKFFGILSGSLSFIFGKLEEGVSLSKATAMARSLGFTEPNPRDDLSGTDVARKLLILAREAGYQLELSDIEIEPLLPANLMAITDIEYFMQNLSKFDDIFAIRVANANAEGKVLRFIGMIEENGICKVKITAVDSNDPLYKVKDGENALIFYSHYYKPIPLVLRGYGAGNNVTAAGIFADLLRTL